MAAKGRLAGKIALITGAAGDIGGAIARRFAGEGAGGLLVTDLEAPHGLAEELSATGTEALAAAADVTQEAQVKRLMAAARERFGGLDALVNCAGISVIAPLEETSAELWDEVLAANARGAFLTCREAIPLLRARGAGCIINLSSMSGRVGSSQMAAYSAAKFAVIGLTQAIAMEFAGEGIRAHAICPGIVWGRMWERQAPAYARKRGMPVEQVRAFLESRIPLGRLGRPEEVADLAAFLASDEAAYLTGQAFNLTGGQLMS